VTSLAIIVGWYIGKNKMAERRRSVEVAPAATASLGKMVCESDECPVIKCSPLEANSYPRDSRNRAEEAVSLISPINLDPIEIPLYAIS
jgi:hypothetical protein